MRGCWKPVLFIADFPAEKNAESIGGRSSAAEGEGLVG